MKPGAVTVPIALRDINYSPIEGATLACTVSIDGAEFTASTNSAVEVGGGDYALALTAGERGTSYTRVKATDGTYTTLVTVTTDDVMRGTDGALLAADYIAPDNASVGAIKAKTDNLPADTAGAIAALPTDADVQAAAQAAIVAEPVTLATDQPFYAPTTWRDLEPLATETTLAAVKAKTDNLPLSPAATGDAMTLTAAERTSVASAVWAATTRTLTDGTGSIQLTFRMLLDSDNDGVPDDPPVGVPDVRCLLFADASGTQPVGAVKLTDTQGYARWYGLAAGTYYMRREKAGMLFDDDPLVVEVVEPV